jgi:5-methylcytosine-specific restriction endonuclease McrA
LFSGKTCSGCGQTLSFSDFGQHATAKDGLRGQCKECVSAKRAAYRLTHHDGIVAYSQSHRAEAATRQRAYYLGRSEEYATYRQEHREEAIARTYIYRQTHPKEVAEYKRAYNLAHHEEVAKATRAYRLAHRDAVAASACAYRLAHREETAAYRLAHRQERSATDRAYREAHHEEITAYRLAHRKETAVNTRAWQLANPHKVCNNEAQRRARKTAAFVEPVDRSTVYLRDNGRCHVCHHKVKAKGWHLDHLIPLSKGGEHSYKNVAVACPACNLKRQNTGPAQLRLMG